LNPSATSVSPGASGRPSGRYRPRRGLEGCSTHRREGGPGRLEVSASLWRRAAAAAGPDPQGDADRDGPCRHSDDAQHLRRRRSRAGRRRQPRRSTRTSSARQACDSPHPNSSGPQPPPAVGSGGVEQEPVMDQRPERSASDMTPRTVRRDVAAPSDRRSRLSRNRRAPPGPREHSGDPRALAPGASCRYQ
jgi:hypothetical protein